MARSLNCGAVPISPWTRASSPQMVAERTSSPSLSHCPPVLHALCSTKTERFPSLTKACLRPRARDKGSQISARDSRTFETTGPPHPPYREQPKHPNQDQKRSMLLRNPSSCQAPPYPFHLVFERPDPHRISRRGRRSSGPTMSSARLRAFVLFSRTLILFSNTRKRSLFSAEVARL